MLTPGLFPPSVMLAQPCGWLSLRGRRVAQLNSSARIIAQGNSSAALATQHLEDELFFSCFFFSFHILFFIGVKLIYNVALFLLYNEVNPLYVYLYSLPLGPPSHPHVPPL